MLVVALLAVVLALAYYYLTRKFSYWKDRGVKYVKPYPVMGSMTRMMTQREHMMQFFQRMYRDHEGERVVGYFQGHSPGLMIRDPELVKRVLIKDFNHFTDHGFKFDEKADPLDAKNLFNMTGHRWREMRNTLSPTFTSGRMKIMFSVVQECAQELQDYLGDLQANEEFNSKDILGRYTTDVIASCVFGIKCSSLKDPNSEFRRRGKNLIEITLWKGLKMAMIIFLPDLAIRLGLSFMDKDNANFFRGTVRDVIEYRQKTGETRKDFMQLLIELKEKGFLAPEEGEEEINAESKESAKYALTEDDVVAQGVVFFMAGFESSASVTSFALLELAVHQEVQQKLRWEIEEVIEKHGGQLTYQAMMDMKYLEQVLHETIRHYPPAPVFMRVCTKNYAVPDSKIIIEEGTLVTIPAHALQNDPQFFPHPEQFDPDRFNDELRNNNQANFMPFGDGPRHCIGNRFALMQSKLGLISVIRKFNVVPCERTEYPPTIDIKNLMCVTKDGPWLKLEKIQQDSD